MYKSTYRCRMCGETFTGVKMSEEQLKTAIIEITNSDTDFLMFPHTCPDSSIAYADFVGFRREK